MIDFKILARATKDDFSFNLFTSLLESVNAKFDAVYVHTAKSDEFAKLKSIRFESPNVVIGIKDILDANMQGEVHGTAISKKILIDCFERHPNTNFIIFTSLENLDLGQRPQIVQWGGDIINQKDEYLTLEPVLEKNFNSDKVFISLNRNPREHRIALLSYLFDTGLYENGQVSYLYQSNRPEFLDQVNWVFDLPRQSAIRNQLLNGYKLMVGNDLLKLDDYHIYKFNNQLDPNNNIENFELRLRNKYKNSFVEIITETTYASDSFNITEKTLHGFYACNFPIMLSSVGTVAFLRQMGFDMFDDIVNNDHDTVEDLFDRIEMAVQSNIKLLTDETYTKARWLECKERFIKNVAVAKSIYDWYENRTRTQFARLHWK